MLFRSYCPPYYLTYYNLQHHLLTVSEPSHLDICKLIICSSQTFKAQMAVGSWAKTPLYPGLSSVTKIIQDIMD
ncbi:hypothetical protein BDQ17DRAFT_1248730 [Cyathus striatus]|nr:hypothetical protein BDQ17DRAFT_1248730 [Cyathus striatus]